MSTTTTVTHPDGTVVTVATTAGAGAAATATESLFIGSYTADIYEAEVDARGAVTVTAKHPAGGPAPSFVCRTPDNKFLYSTLEGGATGELAAFAIGADGKGLTALNKQPSGGFWPCHVVTNGKIVVCANYGGVRAEPPPYAGGNISSYKIQPDGSLSAPVSTCQHAGELAHCEVPGQGDRQDSPHAHQVALSPCGGYVFSMDLGLDTVFCWKLDPESGALTANGSVRPMEKAGPRHMEFHPNGKHAYLINELNSTLVSFDYADGVLTQTGCVGTLPEGADASSFNAVPPPYEAGDFTGEQSCPADIHVHPSGKFVYGSNRGHDSIAVYSVGADGTLTAVGHTLTGGFTPRNFLVSSATRLLVANQNAGAVAGGSGGGNVVAFDIDEATGALTPTGAVSEMKWPVCLCPVVV